MAPSPRKMEENNFFSVSGGFIVENFGGGEKAILENVIF